jgi:hypothetical protein
MHRNRRRPCSPMPHPSQHPRQHPRLQHPRLHSSHRRPPRAPRRLRRNSLPAFRLPSPAIHLRLRPMPGPSLQIHSSFSLRQPPRRTARLNLNPSNNPSPSNRRRVPLSRGSPCLAAVGVGVEPMCPLDIGHPAVPKRARPDEDGVVVTLIPWWRTFSPGASVRETSRRVGEERRGLGAPVVAALRMSRISRISRADTAIIEATM